MALARLRRISYLFPTATPAERRFFADLQTLLEGVPGCRVGGSGLTLPVTPGAALPGTAFVSTDTPTPAILWAADLPLDLDFGSLRLYSTATDLSPGPSPTINSEFRIQNSELIMGKGAGGLGESGADDSALVTV